MSFWQVFVSSEWLRTKSLFLVFKCIFQATHTIAAIPHIFIVWPAVCSACKYSSNSPYKTIFLVHDSLALGENDFMHHLYSTTHLYSPQPTFHIEIPSELAETRSNYHTTLNTPSSIVVQSGVEWGRKRTAFDIVAAQPSFKREGNLIFAALYKYTDDKKMGQ